MNSRWFCSFCAVLTVFFAQFLYAGDDRTVPTVGVLTLSAGPNETIIESFRKGLRQFGYIEGQSVRVEIRHAQGRPERLLDLAKELVGAKVDAIVAGGGPQVRAALEATNVIPVVAVIHEGDPTASGIIESYRRPGGNVTGIYARELEVVGKRLEMLREVMPDLKHLGVFYDRYSQFQLRELESSARSLGVLLHPVEINAPYDFDGAFKDSKRMRADAVMVLLTYAFYARREQLAAAALRAKLPTMHGKDDMVKAGGFISYGSAFDDTWGRAAYFIDRILKGAKPSELPVEQVSNFRLAINQKTATAIGVKVPETILLRADEVIH